MEIVSYARRFFALLELLKNDSDVVHKLQQKDLVDALKHTYDMSIDRRRAKEALAEMQHSRSPVQNKHNTSIQHGFRRFKEKVEMFQESTQHDGGNYGACRFDNKT